MTRTTSRTHVWTARQISFLAASEDMTQGEVVAQFRRTFRSASGEVSDKAIINRRYHVLHPETRKAWARRRQVVRFAHV